MHCKIYNQYVYIAIAIAIFVTLKVGKMHVNLSATNSKLSIMILCVTKLNATFTHLQMQVEMLHARNMLFAIWVKKYRCF